MKDKVFKTYDEQLAILKGRGIDFSPRDEYRRAKIIIQREGYYKLINGYKTPFLNASAQSEAFIEGTTVTEIFALYCFDRELREIFMRHILHVETNIKSLISYSISENYGHNNYLLYSNFNTAKQNAGKEIPTVIAELHQSISKNSADPSIRHYLQNYGYIPMWVLNNVLTLGNISRLYSIMKTPDRQSISRLFKIPDSTMDSFLFTLSIIRNFSAHGNRLYCIRTKRPLVDTSLHSKLNIRRTSANEYVYGKRDLFSAVIALRYLLSANEFKCLIKELNEAIGTLNSKLKVIKIENILSAMGFPPNWSDISNRKIQ